uniref:Geranylgeranyl diphosphate synthase n=1 Tax=Coccolithus braarudii TaxID=221442 RepID=A0A7S0Q168_9EUKA|mmetsp:Transcript_3640/g.7716  ORF Transcript_3640/g.7716 Transcript_3640/m.7716 type:complete len:335 (+) Transcript_3640:54-1058(+)
MAKHLALALVASTVAFELPAVPARAPRHVSPCMSTVTVFDLGAYMEEKRVITEAALDASLTSTCTETETIIESMRYSLMAGGKRVRPMLCFAATEMFGGDIEAAKPAAVALEMIHTMSLIHDDLPAMDNDDFRRGKPTNHVLYGDDVAILAGDAMLSESFAHVARETKGVPAERVVKVLGILGDCVGPLGLAGGQVMDLKCEGKGVEVSYDTLVWIHTHKTAALLKAAVACGAVLAGASDEEVEKCNEYALKIGLAFQVADDILDLTASTEELGKTAGKDLDADKTTYPKLLGLDRSREVAQELVDEAKAAIAEFGDAAAPLNGLADYIINRKN